MQEKAGTEYVLPSAIAEVLQSEYVVKVSLGNGNFHGLNKLLGIVCRSAIDLQELPILKYRCFGSGIVKLCAIFLNARLPFTPMLHWSQLLTSQQKYSVALDAYAIRRLYLKVKDLKLDYTRDTIVSITYALLDFWRGMLGLL